MLTRMSQLFPEPIDLSLHRIVGLLATLGNPHRRLPPVIHVAGTNGKGSTIAFLRSILEASGRSVHVYTSPHLVKFNERIRIAGNLIDDEELADLLEEVELENAGRPITFFEATTAAAFLAFSRHSADFTIIETGMGGRLDATNVVPQPTVTAITPITLDHTNYLGSTISAIARQKAGILRREIPVAIGPQCKEAGDELEAAANEINAFRYDYGTHWVVEAINSRFFYTGRHQLMLPRPLLAGDHQLANAGLAVAILDLLPNLRISPNDYVRGILNTEWPARLMLLPQGIFDDLLPARMQIVLDGGHNEGAARALATWANALDGELDIIVGMFSTKNPRDFLRPLVPYVRRMRGVMIAGSDHSHSSTDIVMAALDVGIANACPASSVLAALVELSCAPAPRRVLICGSVHLAGQFLSDVSKQAQRFSPAST